MGTALVTSTGKPSKRLQELLDAEDEVIEAAGSVYGNSYVLGAKIAKLKAGTPPLYQESGCKTWKEYCASGRIPVGRSQADALIICAALLPKLPKPPALTNDHAAQAAVWPMKVVEQIARCDGVEHSKRVAQKLVTYAKKAKRMPTVEVAKQFVDQYIGEPRKKAKRAALRWNAGLQPGKALEAMLDNIIQWHTVLTKQQEEYWIDAEEESPGIVGSLTQALDDFASFMKG